MVAKLSFQPQPTRAVLNVYAFLCSPASPLITHDALRKQPSELSVFTLTEGQYLAQRNALLHTEALILRSLSYVTRVMLPHPLALTYLQTLSLLPATPTKTSRALATRTLALLNSALLSPQLLYLTHQPSALAVAAVYLACRETGVKLGGGEWWRVWDVGREELGFLVVGLMSVGSFVEEEKRAWEGRTVPITVEELVAEMTRRERIQKTEGK